MASISYQDRLESIYLTEKTKHLSLFSISTMFGHKGGSGGGGGTKAMSSYLAGLNEAAVNQLVFNARTSSAEKSWLLLVVFLLYPGGGVILPCRLIIRKLDYIVCSSGCETLGSTELSKQLSKQKYDCFRKPLKTLQLHLALRDLTSSIESYPVPGSNENPSGSELLMI